MVRIIKPNAAEKQTVTLPADAGERSVELAFGTAEATVERIGNDLVFRFEDGAETRVTDFFVTNGEALPAFVLADGAQVSGADVLRQFNSEMDLETAAGPNAASRADGSGGSGEYADDAGALVDGIDRLGSLGTDYWARGTEVSPPLQANAVTAGLSAETPGIPGIPNPGTPGIPEPGNFLMIGHTAMVERLGGGNARSIVADWGDRHCMAAKAEGEVIIGEDWVPNYEGTSCYKVPSSTGDIILYNPETGYFGHFIHEDKGDVVNRTEGGYRDQMVSAGFYHDSFPYEVKGPNGEAITKTGHVLYVNDALIDSRDLIAGLEVLPTSSRMQQLQLTIENLERQLENSSGNQELITESLAACQEALEKLKNAQQELYDALSQELADLKPEDAEWVDMFLPGDYRVDEFDEITSKLEIDLDAGGTLPGMISDALKDAGFDALPESFDAYLREANQIFGTIIKGGSGDHTFHHADLGLSNGSSLELGDGNDSVIIRELTSATISTGAGNDTVEITQGEDDLRYDAVLNGKIFMGEGNDALTISHSGDVVPYTVAQIYTDRDSPDGPAYNGDDEVTINGDFYGSIYTDGGNDSVLIRGESGSYWDPSSGAVFKTIDLGDGNDTLTVLGDLNNVTVDTGSGNDVLNVGSVSYSDITLGSGNDILRINGSPDCLWESTVDGGSSEIDRGSGQLGDILSFQAKGVDWVEAIKDMNDFGGNTIKNFDALYLDLSNGEAETINIDDLLGHVKDIQSEGKFSSIVITGDESDSALLTTGTDGWTAQGIVNNLQGMDGNFTHYTNDEGMNLYIAIQQITGTL